MSIFSNKINKSIHEMDDKFREDYEKIFHNLPFILITFDNTGRLLKANKYAEELTGKSFKDYRGKSFHDFGLLSKKDLFIAAKEFAKNLLGHVTSPTVYTVTLSGGEKRKIEFIGIPIKENGHVIRVVDVGREVTNELRIKESLRESEKIYRLITENAKDQIAIITFEINPKYVYLSPSHEANMGWKIEDHIGKEVFLDVHPDDRFKLVGLVKKYLVGKLKQMLLNKAEVMEKFQYRVKDKKGNYHILESTATFIENNILVISRDISEHIKLEEELKKNREMYKSLYENAPIGIYEIDFQTKKVKNPNDYMCRFLGYTKDEMEKLSAMSILTRKSQLKFLKRIALMKIGKKVSNIERFTVKTKAGKKIEAEIQAKYIRKNGRIIGAKVVAQNISEKLQYEEAIKKKEEILKKAEAIGNIGSWEYDVKRNVLWGSDQAKKIFGFHFDGNETSLEELKALIVDKDKDRVHQALIAAFKEGAVYNIEYDIKTKDTGKIKILHSIAEPFRDEKGAPEKLVGIIKDITIEKQADEKLRYSEAKFRQIFEGSRDGYVMVDKNERIIDANNSYCTMLGYSINELRKMKNFYDITPKKWWKWEREEIWNNRLIKKGYSGIYEKEYIRKNGEIFPVEIQSYCIYDSKKNVKYLWGVARDISDRKKIEKKISDLAKFPEENPDPVIRVAFDGRLLYANEAARNISDIFNLNNKIINEDLGKAIKEGIITNNKINKEINTGGRIYLFTIAPNKQDAYLNLYGREITLRKKAEEESLKMAREWSRTFDSMADGLSIHSSDYTIINVNSSLCKILGKEKKEMIGQKCFHIFHDTEEAIDNCPMVYTLKYKKEKRVEIYEKKLGKWLSVYTSPILDSEGRVEKIIHVVRDISERKQIDEEYRNRNFELEKSNKLMVGRELKMMELKKKIKILEEKLQEKNE
jgi:PAS domain S-box-containing protein